MIRLLKFDIIHPREYLDKKKEEWDDLAGLSMKEYRERLIGLRSNYSDYYTHHLDQTEEWQAEEFFLMDEDYLSKAAKKSLGPKRFIHQAIAWVARRFLKDPKYYQRKVVQSYIQDYQPDVIFVRSHPLPSSTWKKFRGRSLLVARLSARLPYNWHPNDWDLLYTDLDNFKRFFELHGVPTIINDQGFDQRINQELKEREPQYECTFVGGLGTENFSRRTRLVHYVSRNCDFQWWGYWWQEGSDLAEFPGLEKTFRGSTSGLEMYQIYKDSKICLNDYVDTAGGIGFNQRMFEVMGVGGFLLTRRAPNFEEHFPEGIFATYENDEDCIQKIQYYLDHPEERKQIAEAGRKYIAKNYDYSRIALEFGEDCKEQLKKKNLLNSSS